MAKSFVLCVFLYSLCASAGVIEMIDHLITASPLQGQPVMLENMNKDVNWSDPIFQQLLWGQEALGASPQPGLSGQVSAPVLDKRAGDDGALIKLPSCLKCSDPKPQKVTIDMFTSQYFISKMLTKNGACVFYGQRPQSKVPPYSLSKTVSDWVCTNPTPKVRSLWQLFPQGPNIGEYESNFYCADPRNVREGCWLNPLMEPLGDDENTLQARIQPYFEQMSEAMALTCEGEVFVAFDNADDVLNSNLNARRSIWLSHELPALQQLYYQGKVTKLTVLVVVNNQVSSQRVDKTSVLKSSNLKERYADWEPSPWAAEVARAVMERRKKLDHLNATVSDDNIVDLEKRDGCDGWRWENPELDYFG